MITKLRRKIFKPPHNLSIVYQGHGVTLYGYTDYKFIHKQRADKMRMMMKYELDLGLPHEKLLEYLAEMKVMNDKGLRSDLGTVINNLLVILQNRTSIENRIRIADQITLLDNEPIEGGAKWYKKKKALAEKHADVLFFFVSRSGEFLQHLKILSHGSLKKASILHLKSLEDTLTQKMSTTESKLVRS